MWCVSMCILFQTYAQNIPVGTWRTHLSYYSIQTLAIAENQVYAGADNGFFVYDQATGSSTILSGQDGFSNTQVSQMAYNASTQTLLICYQDGNIDLLHDNIITNIDDLATSTAIADKGVEHVYFHANLAYLSCSFGLVVLDMQKNEIRETYRNLGPGGSSVTVRASAVANNTLFVATSQGILTAPLAGVNLLDFNNWILAESSQGIPAKHATSVASRNGKVYAGIEDEGVFVFENGTWQTINLPLGGTINRIEESKGFILICLPGKVIMLDAQNTYQQIENPLIQAPESAQLDAENKLWIADPVNGLLSNYSGAFSSYVPNGPVSNEVWRLVAFKQNILALPGGFTSAFNRLNREGYFSIFTPSGWENYSSAASTPDRQIPEIKDLTGAAYNPSEEQLYIGSFGDGLLVFKPGIAASILNATNSPLQASVSGGVAINELATDAEGNVWMTVYGAPVGKPSLYVKRADNTWQSYLLTNPAARFPVSLLIDDNGYKWMPLANPSGGIWVFDEKSNQSKYVSTAIGQGGLPGNIVSAMTTDKEGQIWIGTDRGVAVFFNPSAVFENNTFDALTPVFDRRPLLRDEVIHVIIIDAGNRKWIGTRNGLWLFSPDGSELVHHFTRRNSPLLSDIILDIQIQPVTGEVFIATDKGIVSYRGTATQAEDVHTDVKVFPNPVRPEFDGLISISGLVSQASVKITDITGRLVYQTQAQGSTAVWNGRDYTGRKAATGIYLIFSSNDEGTETLVSKIAFIE